MSLHAHFPYLPRGRFSSLQADFPSHPEGKVFPSADRLPLPVAEAWDASPMIEGAIPSNQQVQVLYWRQRH